MIPETGSKFIPGGSVPVSNNVLVPITPSIWGGASEICSSTIAVCWVGHCSFRAGLGVAIENGSLCPMRCAASVTRSVRPLATPMLFGLPLITPFAGLRDAQLGSVPSEIEKL